MSAVLADLSQWELFSTTLHPFDPGLGPIQRKIENLRLIIARYEEEED